MDCRHNHPRPKDLHGHYRAGRLKDSEYTEVDKMTRARMPPRKILSKLKEDDKNNKTTLQQIYNARSTLRRKDFQDKLVMQQLLWLAQKKNYACQKKLDEFGHVTHLFIAHPECVKLELYFPQVLILDCTYKPNKYEIPLMNVDGEREVKKKKFKNAYEANERMWVYFSNDWNALQWSITEEVYEENVAKLLANWSVKYPEIIIYLRKQFLDNNKHRFVSAFKNHHKHFYNQATSMVESDHYRLKMNLFGKSLMMKHDDHPDDKWLRGLTHMVSHLCLELIMKEVDLMEKMDANSQEECVCKMRESMGLLCRHDLLRYKD
ncbi:uncharacterized protein LOC113359077 [Papaver somniferum]|uniref:uncharacterized protein LOC113359077 n=1 Tax=Papaver somniferum TaxID=3469 RepID=UPI000E6FD25C|nr:uncharacterized protein LOC113359077 [Papaver somniferum]